MGNRPTIDSSKIINTSNNILLGLFNNFISGFILGIITGFFGNMLYDWYKTKRRGKKPIINATISGDLIRFEGQIQNTQSSQTALNKLISNVEN